MVSTEYGHYLSPTVNLDNALMVCLYFIYLVAEQAESIDNPMHEAAKRGATTTYRSEPFNVFFISLFVVTYQDNSFFLEKMNTTPW